MYGPDIPISLASSVMLLSRLASRTLTATASNRFRRSCLSLANFLFTLRNVGNF